MKQIIQNLKTGDNILEEIPCPIINYAQVLIQTKCSLISAGTERMLVEFSNSSFIGKIRQQPEKVKMVLDKIKTDGLLTTLDAIKNKLNQPIPLGYCNVGEVVDVHSTVLGFKQGDRVISNGSHAEIVSVSENLCAHIPKNVSDEEASFTVLGAIALQGIRLVQPTLGESFVVMGLGLIGLLTVQLLVANGCRVLGLDYSAARLSLAEQFGAETLNLNENPDPLSAALEFSRGCGVDGVIITASTKSNDPIHHAAMMCRKRGRIILVGVTGLNLNRADFYEKELSFQVSCSYGPGRYENNYEAKAMDYPIGYVRWTEQRNFEAFLDMLSMRKIDVKPLITHAFDIENATHAYEVLQHDKTALGIMLNYPRALSERMIHSVSLEKKAEIKNTKDAHISVGFIGAGNYATRMLIPAFKKTGIYLKAIVSNQGLSGVIHGKRHGFSIAATSGEAVYADPEINVAVIATRHNLHAEQVISALSAGKHVFVEKPLAITQENLESIKQCYESILNTNSSVPLLMVGFNRRFAPHILKIKQLISALAQPKSFMMTINAGAIPLDHWTQDPQIGGGRLVGEACHFVDLLRFLAGAPITSAKLTKFEDVSTVYAKDENVSIALNFADGSFGIIHYLANGTKEIAKERLEIFCEGKTLQLDNFIKLRGYGFSNFKKLNFFKQDKGQDACVDAFIQAIKHGQPSPIPYQELIEVAQTCLDLANEARRS